MGNKLFDFESKQEKRLFLGIIGVLLIIMSITFYPAVSGYVHNKLMSKKVMNKITELKVENSKTPEEYYKMFQCSCCGQPIDTGCCGMAKQRKDYLDKLLLEDLKENEIVYRMVKKFGFDVLMDQSKEQEIRDYIKSKASDNPPRIEIENPRYNFGTISQSDGIVTTIFIIKNSGSGDLVIENLDTSCMCTTASLIYNGQESPRFSMSMHGENPDNFELRIPPGETTQLKVFYDPMAHGKQKKPETKITRTITIISNDPVDFQKKVRIELTQLP